LPLLFDFVLEYAIRKVQENQVGRKLNVAHLLVMCANDIYLLGYNGNTTKKNTKALIDASNEVSL
jgi:hypothetical protein